MVNLRFKFPIWFMFIFVEYVENYAISDTLRKDSNLSLEQKWTEYLGKEQTGQAAFQYILRDNPQWKTAKTVASEICAIYRFSSHVHHSTANELHHDKTVPIILKNMQMNAKLVSVSICLAQAVGLNPV
jgi:hypothetical protein